MSVDMKVMKLDNAQLPLVIYLRVPAPEKGVIGSPSFIGHIEHKDRMVWIRFSANSEVPEGLQSILEFQELRL